MNERIALSLPHMGGNEQRYVDKAIETNWVVPLGPDVQAFEKLLGQFLIENAKLNCKSALAKIENGEQKPVVALSSGTAAIHLALVQLGVGYGDEVICQSFTFAASANPIVYLGAKPVFVDSEPDTWNMSAIHLEEAIVDRLHSTGKKPKAIIPVHLYGMPCNMDEIMDIAYLYDIPVLEDAAEALGSSLNGRKCGTFGKFAALSFNGNKIITTSGGGALVCPSQEEADSILFYATQARDDAPHYQHTKIGYNYRMSNICAAIGRGQMEVLPDRVNRRREINQMYRDALKDIPGIRLQTEPSADYYSNYWLTSILIDPTLTNGVTREDIRLACGKVNIETRPLWKPMHLQPVFRDCPFYGDGTSEKLFENGLCLPSGSILTDEQIQTVITFIQNSL